jgi:hypothetical protein
MNTSAAFSRRAALVTFLVALAVPCARADRAGEEMAAAATKFLSSLKSDQTAKASFPLKDEERLNWHFIPKDRKGLPFKDINTDQRQLALDLLKSGMSERGFGTATNIMSLEVILQDLEGSGRRFPRDPALYYVSVFGKPEKKGTWAWRVEGHHLAVNYTIVAGQVASTPSFFGSNPAEVRKGARKGLRVLAQEEDAARELLRSLNEQQRKQAIYDQTAPKDILTEAKKKVTPLDTAGIAAAKLDKDQKAMLMRLIQTYVERTRPDVAEVDLAKIKKAGLDKIYFAWAGSAEPGQGHYYRVQGPTFLMEYDNTQNDANHIHAVWRDFNGDFGEDLLQKHYRESPH